MFETTIKYVAQDDKGNDRSKKENFICENYESFSEVESTLYEDFGTFADFSVEAIKRSKIKEVANERSSKDDMIWMAELQDTFLEDNGNETQLKYKIVFYSKTYETANAFITEYARQGYNMSLISLKLTNFSDVI